MYFGILLYNIADSNFFTLQILNFQFMYPGDKPWKRDVCVVFLKKKNMFKQGSKCR